MPKTKYLSEAEKRYGRHLLYWSEIFNGIGFSLLGDTIIYLLAVHFGAGNIALGYISSATYIAGLILPFAPMFIQGRNMIKVQALMWILRGLFCVAYLALFYLQGGYAIAVLLGTYTVFCIFRMLGIILNDFTQKSVSSATNRGRVVANLNVAYQGSSIFVKFISSIITSVQRLSGLVGLIGLQMIGVLAYVGAAMCIRKIPCRANVEYKKGRTISTVFHEAMGNIDVRMRLFLRWTFLSLSVVLGMSVPFMSTELHLESSLVILYSVAIGLSVVLSGIVSRHFADRLGSRPLIIWSSWLLLVLLVCWVFAPSHLGPVPFFIFGFLANFALGLINILSVRLVAFVIPDDDAVSFTSMTNFVIAVLALVVGVVSGILVDAGDSIDGMFLIGTFKFGNDYSFMFIFAFVIAAIGLAVAFRFRERGSYSTNDAAHVVFSVHGIQAVSMIEKLNHTEDPAKRKALLLALGSNLTGVATSELRAKLASPFSEDKQEVVQALGYRPRQALVDDLIRLACDDDSFVQLDAIATLGAYGKNEKAKRALVGLLDGKWSSVRSVASKSLARIMEGPEYLDTINILSMNARHIDEEIDYLIAKRYMDHEGKFYRDFFLSVRQGRSATFRQTRYAVLASFLHFGSPRLAKLFELMNNGDVSDFLTDFLTEARDISDIDEHYDEIFAAFNTEDWRKVRDICLGMAYSADVSYDPRFENLRQGILAAASMDLSMFDVQDALAELYFCYSLKKNSRS